MIISYSNAKLFRQCQRQWYFKAKLAHWRANDPLRREAYILSKLQTLWAWRGQLVDQIISQKIITAINHHRPVSLENILCKARKLFDLQIDFASRHGIREPGISKKLAGDAFAAWHALEYGELINNADIEAAWQDIEQALQNFFAMADLWDLLHASAKLIVQRSLQFNSFGFTVKATPDLIAFFNNDPPLIIDWKVHTFGFSDYRHQLALYALALASVNPHSDFPIELPSIEPTQVRLLEIQLLAGQQRSYHLSESDIAAVEDFIAVIADEMHLAGGSLPVEELNVTDFATAYSPDQCQRCPFRKLCWNPSDEMSNNQYFPNYQPGFIVGSVSALQATWPPQGSARVLSEPPTTV